MRIVLMLTLTEDYLPLQSLYRWERTRPGRVFLTQPLPHTPSQAKTCATWTWAQAADEARRMAAFLKRQGWEPGTRVAILSKNCAWWIMADLAIWMAGYVSVPIYPSLKARTVRQILEHSEAKGCFVGATDEKETATEGVPDDLVSIAFPTASLDSHPGWNVIIADVPPIAGSPTRPAESLATIIYTSGTTGLPKGVMHSFAAFRFNASSLAYSVGLSPDTRALSYLPLAHIMERVVEAVALFLGWQIFFTAGLDTFIEDLQRARPTLFISVPRLLLKFQQGVFRKMPKARLEKLLRAPLLGAYVRRKILRQLGLGHVSVAASGSAPLPIEILIWYRGLGLNLAEGFGMTETMITHLPRPDAVRPGYVGPAIEGVQTRLSDDGELLIKSPMNMLGYYKDPEGTEDAFTEDGFFRTGDLAHIAADGQLKIIGRLKEQFKTSKGKYVAPAPIEGRLMAHPEIETCCLMGAGLPSPLALVVVSPETWKRCFEAPERQAVEETLRAVMEEVNAELDPHERLAMIAVVEGPWSIANGMVTPTLKIRRSALEIHYQSKLEEWRAQNRPIVWESVPAARMEAYETMAMPESPVRHSD
ncbi:MAG TPA: AMP-binding protein [Bryobacteraceae bacterium]|nr:AMP-binding protein [Bryobacteraceae bacterium]